MDARSTATRVETFSGRCRVGGWHGRWWHPTDPKPFFFAGLTDRAPQDHHHYTQDTSQDLQDLKMVHGGGRASDVQDSRAVVGLFAQKAFL